MSTSPAAQNEGTKTLADPAGCNHPRTGTERVWADGYGIWHAEVQHRDGAQEHARQLIIAARAELAERQTIGHESKAQALARLQDTVSVRFEQAEYIAADVTNVVYTEVNPVAESNKRHGFAPRQ